MSRRVERAAARAVAGALWRLVDAVRAAAPSARVEDTGEGVRVEGRGVAALLRWPAGLLR